jgi:serine/threonine protein kinase
MAQMCYQHTQMTPPPPMTADTRISPRLSAIIMRCLKKDPADRFNRVEEISSLLA